MYLKDRVWFGNDYGRSVNNGSGHKSKKEICHRFNKGLCTAGKSCCYDHRCFECGKFGHGEHICHRKTTNNQGERQNTGGNNGNVGAGNSSNQTQANK